MTIHDIVDELREPSLWLREQVWAQWTLLGIAGFLSFLLLMRIARRRRRAIAGSTLSDHVLVPLGAHEGVSHAHPAGGEAGLTDLDYESWTPTAAQSRWSDTPIRQLRREIIKRDQNEARLEQELAALRATNVQLHKRVAQAQEMSEMLRQKIAELSETRDRAKEPEPKPRQAEKKEAEPASKEEPVVMAEAETKQCRKCKKKKASSEFHKNASSSDGLSRWCKSCKSEAQRKSRRQRTVDRTPRQLSGLCADAPLCVLHHRQADRIKRARRRRPRDVDQSGGRLRRFRSPLSSPGLHCPKR